MRGSNEIKFKNKIMLRFGIFIGQGVIFLLRL